MIQTGAVRLISSSKALAVLTSNALVFVLVLVGKCETPIFIDFLKWSVVALVGFTAAEDAASSLAKRPARPAAPAVTNTTIYPPGAAAPAVPPQDLELDFRERETPPDGIAPLRVPVVGFGS